MIYNLLVSQRSQIFHFWVMTSCHNPYEWLTCIIILRLPKCHKICVNWFRIDRDTREGPIPCMFVRVFPPCGLGLS